MKRSIVSCIVGVALLSCVFTSQVLAQEYLSGIEWAKPQVIDPGPPNGPPSDAVVLFDGTDMSKWNGADKWTVKDGCRDIGRRTDHEQRCIR